MTLHDGDTPVDADQLRRLLDEQRPDLADAPLQVVEGPGTDHVLVRVGHDLVARLPRNAPAAVSLGTELRWLPRLVDRLALPLPRVEHDGVPGAGYPFAWALLSWLDGHDLCAVVLDGPVPRTWADDLADLVTTLRAVDVSVDAPQGARGGDVATRAAGADDVLTALAGRHRVGVLRRALDLGREAAPFAGPPVLLHADLIPGNLLHRDGRLTGLLDLGALTTGDPAWDLTPAWWVLDAPGRSRLRDLLGGDDAVWARARALATVQGALATWHYTPRRHPLAALGDRALQQVAADLSRA